MDYILENDTLRAVVRSKGAELVSVIHKATGAEMMWQAGEHLWTRYAPILFPYCGRLKDGKFTHKDVVYQGGQHGFARDMEHTLDTQDGTLSVTLCLEANALTMEKFPFAFKMFSTYTLDGACVRHAIRVENDGDEAMPFGFGYHPGFLCPFDAQHKAEEYALVFDTPETPTVIECGHKSGLVTGKQYTYFENGTEILINDRLFAEDSICFTGLHSKTLSLVERGTDRRVTVGIEGFPYVLIWSMPGTPEFVCIEPWHTLPDTEDASGVWTQKKPAIVLQAGEHWETELPMTFVR